MHEEIRTGVTVVVFLPGLPVFLWLLWLQTYHLQWLPRLPMLIGCYAYCNAPQRDSLCRPSLVFLSNHKLQTFCVLRQLAGRRQTSYIRALRQFRLKVLCQSGADPTIRRNVGGGGKLAALTDASKKFPGCLHDGPRLIPSTPIPVFVYALYRMYHPAYGGTRSYLICRTTTYDVRAQSY
jgi:hypothetical protein